VAVDPRSGPHRNRTCPATASCALRMPSTPPARRSKKALSGGGQAPLAANLAAGLAWSDRPAERRSAHRCPDRSSAPLGSPAHRSPITPAPTARWLWWLKRLSSGKGFQALTGEYENPDRRLAFSMPPRWCGWPCRMRFSIACFVDHHRSGESPTRPNLRAHLPQVNWRMGMPGMGGMGMPGMMLSDSLNLPASDVGGPLQIHAGDGGSHNHRNRLPGRLARLASPPWHPAFTGSEPPLRARRHAAGPADPRLGGPTSGPSPAL